MEQQHKKVQPRLNATAFAIVFLGICFIISAIILSGKFGALNKTIEAKAFFSPAPGSIVIDNGISGKAYLNQAEAAEYLRQNEADIAEMLKNGQLTGYVKTSAGEYIISKKALDDWFTAHQSKPPKAAE